MERRTFRTHTLDDPALAQLTPSQAVTYGKTRRPEDLGELIGEPMLFTFRRLTRDQRLFAEGASTDAERYERAFMAGILTVSGGLFADVTGPEDWTPEGLGSKGYVAMSPDERDYLEEHLGAAVLADVGCVIYVRSWLRPKADPLFPLPPSSLLAWDALHRPSAEPSPADVPQNNEERSAALA